MAADAKIFTINWKDIGKATIVFFTTSVATSIYNLISAGDALSWNSIKLALITGGMGALGYFLKNFLSNSDGQFLTKEKP